MVYICASDIGKIQHRVNEAIETLGVIGASRVDFLVDLDKLALVPVVGYWAKNTLRIDIKLNSLVIG